MLENKKCEDIVVIECHHVPGAPTSTICAQNMRSYKKEYFEVEGDLHGDEAALVIKNLKNMYPNYQIVEFKY